MVRATTENFGTCTEGLHLHAVIWDALKAACDADLPTAKVILESAGVVVASDNMTVCYDERGVQAQALLHLRGDTIMETGSAHGMADAADCK